MDQGMVEVALQQAPHGRHRIARRIGEHGGAGGAHLLAVERHQRQQQIALRAEIVVDRARREAGATGDLIDAGGGESIAPEEKAGGGEDVLAPARLLPLSQAGHEPSPFMGLPDNYSLTQIYSW